MNSPSMADSSGDMQKMVFEAMNDIKSQGVFDQFRRECLADVDTKPTAQNLSQRVEAFVGRFLAQQQWNPSLKKNQLRDSLRKHISQSGMLTQGIDRIIEQIVNPKIFQVIKPKVDEAVCACLGLDVKLWQAENARHREEMQCLQQAIHHAQLDANIKDMQKKELEKQQQHMAEMQQQQQTYVSDNADFSFPPPPPPPGVYSQLPPLPQATSPFYPQPQFDNPFSFGGFGQHGFPNYMPGWMAPFYGLPPTSLGVWGTPQCSESTALQTPLPPTSQLIPPPPPGIPSGTTVDIPGTEALSSTSVSMASMHPPLPDATQAVPEMKPPVPPPPACSSASGVTPPLPLVPAPDPPPPPAVSDVGMPLSTGAPAASHSSHFFISPRMMAEAMIKTTEISTTRRERRKVRVDESLLIQRDEGGDYEPPLHIVRSLFAREGGGVTAAISSDGTDKCWLRGFDRDASGGVKLGDEAVDTVPVTVGGGEVAEGTVGDEIGRHKYKFAWKEDDDVALGDVTISSVHTSDLSSFTDSDSTSEADVAEEATDGKTKEAISRGVSVLATDGLPGASCHSKQAGLSLNDSLPLKAGERQVSDVCLSEAAIRKPRKLLALSYNYSDSDNEESREERRMRCAREKEERYLRRQARRAEMEVARKKKEEERQQHVTAGRNGDEDGMVVSLSEQRRQPEGEEEGELRLLTDNFRALASEEGTPVKDEGVHVSTYLLGEDSSQLGSAGRVNRRDCDERPCATAYTLSCALPSAVDERSSQDTVQFTGLSEELSSPLKKRRTKAEMKEELMQQKVEQRKAMRSRRQRTLNRRYLSDEFTSIFTENLQLAPHLGFSDPNAELVEQIVEVDATLELDSTSPVYLHDMEVQGECVIETETVSLLDGSAQLGIDLDAGDAAVTPVLSGVDTVTPFVAGDDSVTPVIAVDDTVTPFVACDDCVAPVLAGDGAVTTFVAGDDGVTSVLAGDDTVCETGVSEVVSQDLAHDTDGDVAVGYSGDLSDDAAQGREAYNDGDSVIEASADSFCVDENMFVLEQQHIGTGQVEEAICVGEQVSSRVSSPYSDIVSDESHGRSSASSLSAPSARFSSFHQRRVLGKLSSSDSDASVYKSSPKRSSQRKKPSSDDQRRHRRSGRLSGLRQASDKHHSRRTKHRHRTKKLSKRRSDHREFHVRHSLHDGHVSRLPQQRSSVRHGHHSRRRRHRDEQPVVAGTSENVRRPAHVGGRREPPPPLDSSAPTTSRQRPAVVSSVMADLELEPVSADDSTFDEIVGRSDSGGEVDENGSRPVSSTVSGVRSEMVADDVKGCQTLSEGEVSEEEGEVKEPDDWIPYHPQLVPARAARFADDVHNPQPCGPVMIRCGSWTGPRASISGLHYPAKQLFPRAVEHIRYRNTVPGYLHRNWMIPYCKTERSRYDMDTFTLPRSTCSTGSSFGNRQQQVAGKNVPQPYMVPEGALAVGQLPSAVGQDATMDDARSLDGTGSVASVRSSLWKHSAAGLWQDAETESGRANDHMIMSHDQQSCPSDTKSSSVTERSFPIGDLTGKHYPQLDMGGVQTSHQLALSSSTSLADGRVSSSIQDHHSSCPEMSTMVAEHPDDGAALPPTSRHVCSMGLSETDNQMLAADPPEHRQSPLMMTDCLYSPINDSSSGLSKLEASPSSISKQSLPTPRRSPFSSSSSSGSLTSMTSQPGKKVNLARAGRRKKTNDLSEGELSSMSSATSDNGHFRFVDLPKSVRRHQGPSPQRSASLAASDISSDESVHSDDLIACSLRKTCSSSSSSCQVSEEHSASPSVYVRRKRLGEHSVLSQIKKRRQSRQSDGSVDGDRSGSRKSHRSTLTDLQHVQRSKLARRPLLTSSSEGEVGEFSPAGIQTPPPATVPAVSMSPVSASSMSDSLPVSLPPTLHSSCCPTDTCKHQEPWLPSRPQPDVFSPVLGHPSPSGCPSEMIRPFCEGNDRFSVYDQDETCVPLFLAPLSAAGLPRQQPGVQGVGLLDLPRESLPPLPVDLMSSPVPFHCPSPYHDKANASPTDEKKQVDLVVDFSPLPLEHSSESDESFCGDASCDADQTVARDLSDASHQSTRDETVRDSEDAKATDTSCDILSASQRAVLSVRVEAGESAPVCVRFSMSGGDGTASVSCSDAPADVIPGTLDKFRSSGSRMAASWFDGSVCAAIGSGTSFCAEPCTDILTLKGCDRPTSGSDIGVTRTAAPSPSAERHGEAEDVDVAHDVEHFFRSESGCRLSADCQVAGTSGEVVDRVNIGCGHVRKHDVGSYESFDECADSDSHVAAIRGDSRVTLEFLGMGRRDRAHCESCADNNVEVDPKSEEDVFGDHIPPVFGTVSDSSHAHRHRSNSGCIRSESCGVEYPVSDCLEYPADDMMNSMVSTENIEKGVNSESSCFEGVSCLMSNQKQCLPENSCDCLTVDTFLSSSTVTNPCSSMSVSSSDNSYLESVSCPIRPRSRRSSRYDPNLSAPIVSQRRETRSSQNVSGPDPGSVVTKRKSHNNRQVMLATAQHEMRSQRADARHRRRNRDDPSPSKHSAKRARF